MEIENKERSFILRLPTDLDLTSQPLIPGTFIAQREKVTLMAKKILLYLYFHNKLVFDFIEMHKMFGGEMKKYLEIVFILSELGFLQRISDTEFVFKGFRGFIQNFNGKIFGCNSSFK